MGKRSHQKTIGRKPYSGRRFVENGNVRIQWFALAPDGTRKRFTQTVGPHTRPNLKLADDILGDELERARTRAGAGPAAHITLRDLLVKYIDSAQLRKLRPRSIAWFRETNKLVLGVLDGDTAARELRRGDVARWMDALRARGLAETTIGRALDHLKRVYRWAVDEHELIDVNPLLGLKTPSRKTETAMYTVEERTRLEKALLDVHSQGWRFHALMLIEAYYGVRANQALHLRWADIDFDATYVLPDGAGTLDGAITFRRAAVGSKGQPDRTLPMFPDVRTALLVAWNRRHDDSDLIMWRREDPSKPVYYQSMNRSLRNLEERAGVAHVRYRAFHAFRRALSTELVARLGLPQGSAWIGDSPEVLLRAYVKTSAEAVAETAGHLFKREGA